MIAEKLGAGRTMQRRVLSAVIRTRIVVRYIRHHCLVSFDLFVHRIVLYHTEFLFRSAPVYSPLLRPYFGIRVIDVLTPMVVMMLAPSFILVVLPKDHFLTSWRMLGYEDVGVSEVMVVASGSLVSLVMEGTILILDAVTRGARGEGDVALAVRSVDVVLLGQLPGECVVMRERRCVGVTLRRSVLPNTATVRHKRPVVRANRRGHFV